MAGFEESFIIEVVWIFCRACHQSVKCHIGHVEGEPAIQCSNCGATWKLAFEKVDAGRASERAGRKAGAGKGTGRSTMKRDDLPDWTVQPPPGAPHEDR
jgi:hypothetical protein